MSVPQAVVGDTPTDKQRSSRERKAPKKYGDFSSPKKGVVKRGRGRPRKNPSEKVLVYNTKIANEKLTILPENNELAGEGEPSLDLGVNLSRENDEIEEFYNWQEETCRDTQMIDSLFAQYAESIGCVSDPFNPEMFAYHVEDKNMQAEIARLLNFESIPLSHDEQPTSNASQHCECNGHGGCNLDIVDKFLMGEPIDY